MVSEINRGIIIIDMITACSVILPPNLVKDRNTNAVFHKKNRYATTIGFFIDNAFVLTVL